MRIRPFNLILTTLCLLVGVEAIAQPKFLCATALQTLINAGPNVWVKTDHAPEGEFTWARGIGGPGFEDGKAAAGVRPAIELLQGSDLGIGFAWFIKKGESLIDINELVGMNANPLAIASKGDRGIESKWHNQDGAVGTNNSPLLADVHALAIITDPSKRLEIQRYGWVPNTLRFLKALKKEGIEPHRHTRGRKYFQKLANLWNSKKGEQGAFGAKVPYAQLKDQKAFMNKLDELQQKYSIDVESRD